MFFQISKSKNEKFPNCIRLNHKFCVNLDNDWQIIKDKNNLIIFKGLIDCEDLTLESIKNEKKGSYTAIVDDGDNIYVLHDQLRAYPLFYNTEKTIITNLYQEDIYDRDRYELKKIYSDNTLRINKDGKIIINHIKTPYNIPDKKYQLNEAVEKINNILNNSISTFCKKNNRPIKINLTGGFDSLLIYSVLKKKNIDFEILDFEYKEWDYFYMNNTSNILKTQPLFSRASMWKNESNVIATGYHGDQIFIREVWLLILFCRLNDIQYNDIKNNFKTSYMYENFIKNEQSNIPLIKDCYAIDKKKIIGKMFSFVRAADFMWHIDKTYYWSPLKDLEIMKIILNLNTNDVIDNAFNCTIQRKLLEINYPEVLDLVSEKKNWVNYSKTFEYIKKERKKKITNS